MTHWSLIYYLSEWAIRLVMLVYVPQRRSAAASRTWLLFIFLFPWPGLFLYWIFGRIYMPRRRIQMQERASRHTRSAQDQMGEGVAVEPPLPSPLGPIATLAARLGDFQPFGGNSVELLPDYDSMIQRLVGEIDSARRHVHLLFYLFAPDETGRRVYEALARAEGRGVKCRVVMDAVGSKQTLRELAPEMRELGIDVQAALPVGPFRRNAARFDLRNHRKLAVIDGRVAYEGSQNLVNAEFVKDHPNEELMVRVTGPVVAQLQAIFLADYSQETGTVPRDSSLFPELACTGTSVVQALPSGPGYQRENAQELIAQMVYSAQERIVITTPYFIPDDAILQAIRTATQRGVDVHLVVSKHANRPVTQLAQRSYYDDLLERGVAIHLYRPRFLHAKHITIDDHIAFIGSTNIDIRSFALNSELNLLVYDASVVKSLREVQERYFSHSGRLGERNWRKRPLRARIAQNTARLADALL